MNYLTIFNIFTTFVIFFFLINRYLIKYLSKFDCWYDHPKINKSNSDHTKPILFVGGILFFVNIICATLAFYSFNSYNLYHFYLFFFLIVIFLFGILDDILNINYFLKTLIVAIVFSLFINYEKAFFIINQINFYYFDKLYLGNFKFIFTLFCFLLFFNLINLFDGLNGLVLSLFIIIDIYLLTYALDPMLEYFIIVSLASCVSLLFFNLRGFIFLGNSGSNIISIINLLFIISIYNNESLNYFTNLQINFDIIFILFFYPGIDMVRLFFYRLSRFKNPFLGDKNHLHHILQKDYGSLYTLLFFITIILTNILLIFLNVNYFIIIFFNSLLYMVILNRSALRER
jgi:UDP-GlcNAc:undecaprenyl-phosphate GlcNAc-1-phosphate transferase